MPGKLKITQVRSLSGRLEKHIRTIKALGLKRMHHSFVHNNTPQIRGMVKTVSFMVKVEEV